MNSTKNYVIVLLALATAVGGAVAWRQYQELIQLRASSLNDNERADWQKRLWAAEKRRHELEDAMAALKANNVGSKAGSPESDFIVTSDDPGPGRRRGGNRGDMAGNFMAMMDKPEIQKLMAIQMRAGLDSRYAALFKGLNLSPAQLEQFKNLLVEKQTAMTDVLAAAREQGIDPRTDPQEFRKLVADTQTEVDNNIKSTLGDAVYAQYQQYQQTLPQRGVVNQLQQSLSYTGTPLTNDQADQMVQILAQNTPSSSNQASASNRATITAAFGVGFGGGQISSPITDAAIAQAQTVLTAPQLQALQQLQQAQQAQAQLTQAMRNQFGGQSNRAPVTATPAAPKTGPGG